MKEMNHTDLTKLEIEEEGVKICMEKEGKVVTLTQPAIPPIPMTSVYPVNQMLQASPLLQPVQMGQTDTGAAQPAENVSKAADKQAEEVNSLKIVSPMVGTFYASQSPDKPAFVKVGDKVKKGQTVCIIEAMKLMNEIESEHDGEIIKVMVNNEQMVEFGQPLFLVK
jgi:acetyl-CoA carboxylase biotin carboxyl carrier protein